ncbi:TPO5 [Candida oxycetoniae]|uniref:TPO5 n=1 Tax=Candida oxycetoniae TaxID=497107 RepID=A0AAI9WX73_9ASCO|nr:TPO5 [Candida oxycetoniae]KAI3403699.2 TPO5 [Candida oxycetoniae]
METPTTPPAMTSSATTSSATTTTTTTTATPPPSYASHFFSNIQASAPMQYLGSLLDPVADIYYEGDEDEIEQIEHFKYKQVLDRKLTVTSVIGLGFSVMGVPFGLSSTLWIALMDGANVTLLYGWILVCIMSLFVVLSLSEIISKYPTAGGVYHFSALLSSEKYSSISSWITGWLLLIGNWTYAISIMFSGSQFILSIFGLQDFEYKEDRLYVIGVFYLILAVAGFVNFKFAKYLEMINKACIFWTIYTVLAIDILLIFFAKRTNSIKQILTTFDNSRSGWPDPLAFIVGLQSPSFTLTGYGMLFSMTDEVKNPEKNMPKGTISAILMSTVTGLIFIIPILTILPELELLLDKNSNIMPIDLVFKISTESYVVSFLMACLMIGTMIFQSIGSLTTASRSTYALARDKGLPMAQHWTQVDSVGDCLVPRNALFLSILVCAVLSLLSLISKSAFNAFMGAAVVSLAVANGIPILLLMLNKRQKIKGAAFRLRKLGWAINGVSVFWIALSIVILCMPPTIKNLTWTKMNYASVVLVLFLAIAAVCYVTWGKSSFTGPPLDTDYFELNNLEAAGRNNLDTFVLEEDEEDEEEDEEEGEEGEGEGYHALNVKVPEATHKKSYQPLEGNSSGIEERSYNLDEQITEKFPEKLHLASHDEDRDVNDVLFEAETGAVMDNSF